MSTETLPIVYTVEVCSACEGLRTSWAEQGIQYEERRVDENQAWLDEALGYAGEVPIIVYPDGSVEVGFEDEIG